MTRALALASTAHTLHTSSVGFASSQNLLHPPNQPPTCAHTHKHARTHTGFKDEWKRKLDEAHADYKEGVKSKPKISKNPGAATGLSMEELIRQQKEMLAEVCICE